jgi:cell division protein FtsI/penicillin-binding protein 2
MMFLVALLSGALQDQTILRTLDAQFTGNYLLIDVASRRMIGNNGLDPKAPVAIGSLIKPFTTIAYGESNGFDYPEFTCTGKECWLPKGHGRVHIGDAIAHSCNAYFLAMANRMNPASVAGTLAKLSVTPPPSEVEHRTLAGMGQAWKFAPMEILSAYAEISRRWAQPGMREAVAGMREAAKSGTARELGEFALAKTGTAPCDNDAGDGFVVALFPTDSLKYALMVRVHNATGARAATALAPAFHRIRDGR